MVIKYTSCDTVVFDYIQFSKSHVIVLYEIMHGDSLLHVSICCKYFATHVLLTGSKDMETYWAPYC